MRSRTKNWIKFIIILTFIFGGMIIGRFISSLLGVIFWIVGVTLGCILPRSYEGNKTLK